MKLLSILALALLAAACSPKARPADTTGGLKVVGTGFELTTAEGKVMRSADLVGATFEMNIEGGTTAMVRIDKVEPDKERPSVLLHSFSVIAADGSAHSLCDADAYGRKAGFPVAGRFNADGTFDANPGAWLLTCTSGSQGKCILWGYDPWGKGPGGESLAPYYQACQHVARADYDGKGQAHTKDGTEIDVWDHIGVQNPTRDPKFVFEAGWAPTGAVCVARTRWPDLITTEALHSASPNLAGLCNEQAAGDKGALIYTAVHPR